MDPSDMYLIIADDDIDDQHVIKQAISETDIAYKCIVVNNGLELMDLLNGNGKFAGKSVRPQLIIMDLNMPLLDGYGALGRMKTNEALRDIPVYMLSTSKFDYDREKSLQLGAADFFSKPYQFEELKAIIKDICARTAKGIQQNVTDTLK